MAKQQFQNVRGTYDILPDRAPAYDFVTRTFRETVEQASFGRIETPILEAANVFTRSVGEGTDIIDKEMYTLKDRSDDILALRPEGTAGVVRAYIQHGLASWPKPVKAYYIGPMFRYERPQSGRYRQHTQMGLEVFGESAASVDAHVILLALRFYKRLGLSDVTVQVNSLGDDACRTKYRAALVAYLKTNKANLAPLDQERLQKNPLRVLDSKEAESREVLESAPQILEYLSKDCRDHLKELLEYLDEAGIDYRLNPYLVRGFDYATRTVFEFYGGREGAQSAIGGGCRYNDLIADMGGQPTPGIGFGIGLERVLLELEGQKVTLPEPKTPQIYVASLGEPARLAAFSLIEQLLDAGVAATGSVDKDGIGAQLAKADKLSVPYAVIIGQKEVMDATVILRDMGSGAQEMLPLAHAAKDLRKRLLGELKGD
jgi:histidyl-tRNA synthetase